MLTFWGAAGAMLLRPTVPFILRRFGFRRVILFNGLIASFFILTPAFFTAETPHTVIAAVILAGGFFRALQFSSVNSLAFADLDSKQMSQATSITSVSQQLALAAGVALRPPLSTSRVTCAAILRSSPRILRLLLSSWEL
jgi:hypothetical protein